MQGESSAPVAGQHNESDQSNDGIPLVFLRESSVFGSRKPTKNEWITHEELYKAIATQIDETHITGLQRVRGLWRIYVDNLNDKVKLMADGVPLRGKTVPVLNTNPQRLDSEGTTRIRIKNIPLSADDGAISRVLTLRGVDVIKCFREKIRINGRLTNCENGDRIVIVKSTSLQEALPNSMTFGLFTARVFHAGQKTGSPVDIKCTKCLQVGHRANQCSNDWVCRQCNKPGHKQAQCGILDTCSMADHSDSSETEDEGESENDSPNQTPKPAHDTQTESRKQRKDTSPHTQTGGRSTSKPGSRQQSIDRFVTTATSEIAGTETPNKGKRGNAPERSPPTPVDELQDKTAKKPKSRKK